MFVSFVIVVFVLPVKQCGCSYSETLGWRISESSVFGMTKVFSFSLRFSLDNSSFPGYPSFASLRLRT